MSGFDKAWLGLREPVDAAARNSDLLRQLRLYLDGNEGPTRIVDIGCGTGSTYRSLAGVCPVDAEWLLLDYDAALLQEAERVIAKPNVRYQCQDLTDLDTLALADVRLLTASAFFDLCSADFCDDVAKRVADHGAAFYGALNYDGRILWENPHPLDAEIVMDFNRHQQTDKGFGRALGPQATPHLRRTFDNLGYRTSVGDSVWEMGPGSEKLHAAFVEGMVAPVMEIGTLTQEQVLLWRQSRLADISQGGICEVGHLDLLALPLV